MVNSWDIVDPDVDPTTGRSKVVVPPPIVQPVNNTPLPPPVDFNQPTSSEPPIEVPPINPPVDFKNPPPAAPPAPPPAPPPISVINGVTLTGNIMTDLDALKSVNSKPADIITLLNSRPDFNWNNISVQQQQYLSPIVSTFNQNISDYL